MILFACVHKTEKYITTQHDRRSWHVRKRYTQKKRNKDPDSKFRIYYLLDALIFKNKKQKVTTCLEMKNFFFWFVSCVLAKNNTSVSFRFCFMFDWNRKGAVSWLQCHLDRRSKMTDLDPENSFITDSNLENFYFRKC